MAKRKTKAEQNIRENEDRASADAIRRKPDPLELAAPVSARVQIRKVALTRSLLESNGDIASRRNNYKVDIKVDGISHSLDSESRELEVTPRFSLRAEKTNEGEGQADLVIEATFALKYILSWAEGLTKEQYDAFAITNGVYNAWPYWREYVQNTVSRMGLPPIIVPVFRLP